MIPGPPSDEPPPGTGDELERLLDEATRLQADREETSRCTRARLRNLEILYDLGQTLGSILELDPLLEKVVDAAIEITGSQRGFLLLREPDGSLTFRLARRPGGEPLEGEELEISRSIAERAMDQGRSVAIGDMEGERTLAARPSVLRLELLSALCVPLLRGGTALGAIYVDSRAASPLGPGARELAEAMAAQAAIAIENARLVAALRERSRRREQENAYLREEISRGFEGVLGRSPAMRSVAETIAKVASQRTTILVRGESGVGKELVARSIHASGSRKDGPFVKVHGSALTPTLLESELFGHEKGAFTGATRRRIGRFEMASGGTLFLDEVGDLPVEVQVKLLRVLQEREFERVGGQETIRVDVRLVAATNRDLEAAIREGAFRQDLYYRLNVLSLTAPPLRERMEDLPELVDHFLRRFARETGKDLDGVTPEAMERLAAHGWPGNIRELQNAIERAVVLETCRELTVRYLPRELLEAAAGPDAPTWSPLERKEREALLEALDAAEGKKAEAARRLGLSRTTFWRKLRKYGIG